MKKRFFQFIFLACACLMCAMPAKADDPDWASMGVTPTSTPAQFCIYHPNSSSFLKTSGMTTDLAQVEFFEVTYDGSAVVITNSANKILTGADLMGALQWADASSLTLSASTSPKYYLTYYDALWESDMYLAYQSGMFVGAPIPDAKAEWIFIPKADFELTQTVGDGMFCYLYNVSQSKYCTGLTLSNSLNTDLAKAALFYVSKVAGTSTYKIAYFNNGSASSTSASVKFFGLNINNSGDAVFLNESSTAAQQQLTLTPIDGTNPAQFYISRDVSGTLVYLNYDESASKVYAQKTTPGDNCKWILKPAADFRAEMTTSWSNDTYVKKAATIENQKKFYLYNPATQVFYSYNGSGAIVAADPKTADAFYAIEDNGQYSLTICKKDGSLLYVMAGNPNASPKKLTFTEVEISEKKFYAIAETSTKKHITAHKDRTGANTGIYLRYVTDQTTYPYTGDVAIMDIHALWVLIPESEAINATTFDPSDEWAQRGTTNIANGGRFYFYNPAAKTFILSPSATPNIAKNAHPFTLVPLSGANAGKYAIVRAHSTTAISYLKTDFNYAQTPIVPFSIERVGETNHYRICNNNQFYLSSKYIYQSSAYSYMNFTWKNAGEGSYEYTPDNWSDWVLIPDSVYEQVMTPAPQPEEEDVYAIGGVEPEDGGTYKLYNVGIQRFKASDDVLTADPMSAVDCEITRNGSKVAIKYNGNKYVAASVGGPQSYPYSSSEYFYKFEEVEGHPGQYYLYYHTLTDYDMHLRAEGGDPQRYRILEIIKPDADKSVMSHKNRWVFLRAGDKYYKATSTVLTGEGNAYVALVNDFSSPVTETAVTSATSLGTYLQATIYCKAIPASEDYQFMGWKTNPEEDFISTEEEYTYTFNVSSTDEEHPDEATLYAYFEKLDAVVYNENGIAVDSCTTFAAAHTAASKGYTIKLMRHITTPITITKGVTIDFNGYTVGSTTSNFVTVDLTNADDTVTFVDGSVKQEGGVALDYNQTPMNTSKNAINVTSGTLVINSGRYTSMQRSDNWNYSPTAYVVNCAGGKVRINGGYFKASRTQNGSDIWSSTHQLFILNGSNIQLYGGYFGGNCDDLQEIDSWTYPRVDNNLSGLVGQGMELIKISTSEPCANSYIYYVQPTSLNENIKATADGKKFTSLADAIAYANNNAETPMTIRLAQNDTLTAGNYVIPAKATLIIPYNSLHTEPLISCPLLNNTQLPKQAYRTLTLEDGVHIDVYGAIELGGRAYSYGNGAQGTGRPNSDYGQMIMNQGSEIVLNSGAILRAWGFVTGDGAIDVRRGATVNEMFQVYDFKGGKGTLAMFYNDDPGPGEKLNTHKAFPINQYYIQNVEVKTTYRPGASLYGAMAAVNVGVMVKIIGVDVDGAALFKMNDKNDSEDTWVRKWYNPATDQQVYDINNSAAISNLKLPLSGVIGVQGADFNSKDYILPITNNFKIHVLAGQIDITQDVAFLPGAELEIDKQCYGNIPDTAIVYLYDADQWGTYVYNNVYASKIKYRPGGLQFNRNISSAANLGDAQMNIHGTLEVNGGFRTTEGGANIYSTNADAGTVVFTSTSVTNYDSDRDTLCTWTHQVYHSATPANNYQASADPYYVELAAKPAKLKNGTGASQAYTPTQTDTEHGNAGKSFCYINNEWRLLTDDECIVHDGAGHYYAKPKDYVELVITEVIVHDEDPSDVWREYIGKKEGDVDTHTYDYVASWNKLDTVLINEADCQWWKVVPVDGQPGLFHCTHPDNDVYYYYDGDEWVEKRFTITWKNWDQSVIDTYQMKMGAKLQYLGSTPNREKTAYYTYDFAGWSPAIAVDATVTGDATYTAQFNQTDRKYIITFIKDEVELETQYLCMGEIPSCEAYTPVGNEQWEPAISAVTGNQIYTLGTNDPAADSYEIRFVNWDGTDLIEPQEVTAGDVPEYTGATPVKPSIGDEDYRFIGWTPDIASATANAVYVAKFEAQKITGLNIAEPVTISDDREVTDLRITTAGALTITGNVTAENFILESNGTNSGQLLGDSYDRLTITGHAYFDLTLNTQHRTWYAVAVPWEVNAETGISIKGGRTLVLGRDFDLVYHDGSDRAEHGKRPENWKYVEYQTDKIMHPGRLYMMYFASNIETLRFTAVGTTIYYVNATDPVSTYDETTGNEGHDANWNGIANPAVYHAKLSAGGATHGYILTNGNMDEYLNDPTIQTYTPVQLSSYAAIVGRPFFIQAGTSGDITVTPNISVSSSAPRRRVQGADAPQGVDAMYELTFRGAGKSVADNMFIQMDEEKADRYVIVKDLVKAGVNAKCPQMWVARYGDKLALNTTASVDGVYTYPLGINIPQAGEYTIAIKKALGETETLYLTYEGEAIWNLSNGSYTGTFDKGETNAYGLRTAAKAPQTATGIEEAVVDAQGETKKVLINDKVYIIRGNKVYSIDGQLVK